MEPGYALPAGCGTQEPVPCCPHNTAGSGQEVYHFPEASGNSSSYLQSAIEEAHSEEWARQTIRYLSDCERHMKMATFVPSAAVYSPPPPFRPLPLAQWFETVHSNDILSHLDEMKGAITSTYGRILKMDSTKKVRVSTVKNIEIRTCIITTKLEMGLLLSGAMSSVLKYCLFYRSPRSWLARSGTVLHG